MSNTVSHSNLQDDVPFPLSPRQHAVIRLRANGLLNKQIATELGIRESTVKEHVSAALKKLQCRTVNQAVLFLAQSGKLN